VPSSVPRDASASRSWRSLAPLAVRALAAAPERLTLILVGLAVASGVTVTFGVFYPYTTLPLAALLIGGAWTVLPRGPRDRRSAFGGGMALAGSAVWFLANIHWAAEYLIVRRDPGFLTLSAIWLSRHPSTNIPSEGTIPVADAVHNVIAQAPQAWNLQGDVIQPQGAKLLPAVAAIGGWIDGTTGVLLANLVIGAVGLLATYALARLFMGPIAALVPAVGLSLTVSHLWLSRADYTEPITMLLLLAAMIWAWQGVEKGTNGPLVASAIASGATLLARIDGPIYALGVAVGVAIALLMSRRGTMRSRAADFVTFALVQGGVVLLGHFSIWTWAEAYVARLGSESRELELGYAAALGAMILALVVAVYLSERRGRIRVPWGAQAPRLLAGATVVVFAVLISRPLWMTTHVSNPDAFQIPVVEYWQRSAGLPIDGTRTYGESTMTWISYYLTWPVVLLGVAGVAVAAHRLGRDKAVWAVPLAGVLIPSLLYIVRPAIIPDQVWAIRRLAPSLIVGLLLFAAIAWQALVARWTRQGGHRAERTEWASVALAALISLAPLSTWFQLTHADGWGLRVTNAVYLAEQRNARAQVDDLCRYIDGRAVILVGTSSHFGTIRVACDVPVVLALRGITADEVATMTEAYGRETVVLTRTLENVPWAVAPSEPTFHSSVYYSTSSLVGLPAGSPDKQDFDWYVGVAQPDGTVAYVPGEGNA